MAIISGGQEEGEVEWDGRAWNGRKMLLGINSRSCLADNAELFGNSLKVNLGKGFVNNVYVWHELSWTNGRPTLPSLACLMQATRNLTCSWESMAGAIVSFVSVFE